MRKEGSSSEFVPPQGVVLCYSRSLLKNILESGNYEKVEFTIGDFYLNKDTNGKVGICGRFGIGAPSVTTVLEEFIAVGITKFISFGAAGGLQSSLKAGDITICTKAIRDEGVSYHYLPPAKYSFASLSLTSSFKKALLNNNISYIEGATWTIDAPYRETKEELQKYRKEGILTVEMEAAALFSVAQYRKVELATAFVVSDIFGEEWEPHLRSPELKQGLMKLYKAAVETLSGNGLI